jgi:hypothetical protein
MEFALSTAQVIACVTIAAAVAVVTSFFSRRRYPEVPDKVTVRMMGSAVVAEPGDVLTIAFGDTLSDEEYAQVREHTRPLIDMGIKVGIVENSTGVAVARGRKDA